MATNEAERKYKEQLAAMSTADVIVHLVESLTAGMNRFKLEVAELNIRFAQIDEDLMKKK